jgi:serine/threonine protein phosphatase PrpC
MFEPIKEWLTVAAQQRSQQLIFDSKVALSTDVGLKRNENQDRVAALQISSGLHHGRSFVCIAVSDGMGGMLDGGECATSTIAALFASLIRNADQAGLRKLLFATQDANVEVNKVWRGKGGATLSAALVEADGSLHCANVGDSRIYALEQSRTNIRRVTIDDSLKEAFGGQGRELVQFIGIGPALVPRVETLPRELDSLFITSDGAHYFDQVVFRDLILQAADPVRATERIVALARWLGGPDNASVAAFRISDVLSAIKHSKASVMPTMWSGTSQLRIAKANFPEAKSPGDATLPPTSAETTEAKQPFEGRSRSTSRRKINLPKKKPQENQLEINISTDENDDAADS